MQSLKRSAASLFAIQMANQVLPLLTLPVVARALGADEFGRMSFVLAVIAYSGLISDYGFNLSASAAISVNRHDRAARSRLFWETLAVKALLAAGCALAMASALLLMPRMADDGVLYAIAFVSVIASVLTPTWYFQGSEQLPLLGLFTFITRASAVPATLWWVRTPADTAAALTITVLSVLCCALFALVYLWRRSDISFVLPSMAGIWKSLADGWHVFLSLAATSLYTNSNTVLLGVIADNRAVALFVGAEKIVRASLLVLSPISQSVYPRISYLMAHSKADAFNLIRRSSLLIAAAAIGLLIVLVGLAPWIMPLVYGPGFAPSVPVLQCMAFLPLCIGLSNVLGIQTMLPLGLKREFSIVLVSAGLVNVGLLSLLASQWGALGAAAAVVLTEGLVTVAMAVWLWWRGAPVLGFGGKAKE